MSRTLRAALALLVVAGVCRAAPGVVGFGAPPAGAQEGGGPDGGRSVVVVSDSIAQGAEAALESRFSEAGWEVTFDAARNRTTYSVPSVIDSHRGRLTDTLVLSLGANDGVSPASFRTRVEAVMAAAADVPRVLWLNLHAVRDGYAEVNQVLGDAAAAHPNLEVLDWNSVAAANAGFTASDRLHLSPSGGRAMADLILGSATAEAAAPTTTVPTTIVPTTIAAPTTDLPTTELPTSAPAATAQPPPTSAPAGAVAVDAGERDGSGRSVTKAADDGRRSGRSGWWSLVGWGIAGFLGVVASLAIVGMCLGAWALWSTRRDAHEDSERTRSASHPAVRARLRAERIAEAARRAEQERADEPALGPDHPVQQQPHF